MTVSGKRLGSNMRHLSLREGSVTMLLAETSEPVPLVEGIETCLVFLKGGMPLLGGPREQWMSWNFRRGCS